MKIVLLILCSLLLGSCTEKMNSNSFSISELVEVSVGDMNQYLLIRGEHRDNPVLLWLHGGPGSSQMPVATITEELEKNFVVVHWDQRGAGKSNPPHFDEQSMSVEQFIKDGHIITEFIKQKMGCERMYLLGHSWGTQFGILLAQRYPDDYAAYIGVSQVVSPLEAHKIGYSYLRSMIKKRNQKQFAALGSPPFTDHNTYVEYAKLIDRYNGGMDISFYALAKKAITSGVYSYKELLQWVKGAQRGSGPMWEETINMNFLHSPFSIDCPVYFISGQSDYNTPTLLVEEFFNHLTAPKGKKMVIMENSSHTPFFANPQQFSLLLTQLVLH